jgi:hypothetical protein
MLGLHNLLMLPALVGLLSGSSEQARAVYQSDVCADTAISPSATCEVLTGDRCEGACFKQDLDRPCVVQCGLQNCHDYDCYEWRCVAYCIGERVSSCLNGCGAEGSLFCDSTCVASGEKVGACADFLCTKGVTVEGASCQ